MRLLKVIPYYYPELKFGGPPLKVHTLARCLREHGLEVTVLTFDSENARRAETVTIDDVIVRYLPWTGRGLRQIPGDSAAIWEAVRKSDVVHVYGLYTLLCPIVVRACRKQGTPYVCEPLGMFPPRQRNRIAKQLYNLLLTKWMFDRSERIVATSAPEYEDLKKSFPEEKILVRQNGIDLADFENLPHREKFLERHGLDTRRRYVLYLGRISPIKNLEEALRAFKLSKLPDYDLLLVGPSLESDYRKKLESLITDLGLQERARFLPPVYGEEKLEALAVADLLVLPSISESFGNSAGEAVAAGIPVLVTTGCGITSIVHEKAGLAVRADAPALADGMQRLLLDPEEAEKVTRRFDEARRELSWDKPVAEALALYRTLARG